jgi:hypothetical protein
MRPSIRQDAILNPQEQQIYTRITSVSWSSKSIYSFLLFNYKKLLFLRFDVVIVVLINVAVYWDTVTVVSM